MPVSKENINDFTKFLCTLCEKEHLKHLDASAIAKVMEYSCRLAEDKYYFSTRFGAIADIVREAHFWALEENSPLITEKYIQKALDEKIFRSNLIEEKIKEMIDRGFILIDTKSKVVGQVNGLAVISLGDYMFGKPNKITVSVGPGQEGIIDIEREVKLGGPIHSKGVLILSGYLRQKFAYTKPLTLSARLVFEQSYEGIEGDSASSAELYAILSALADVPINQGIAVTGSVNQKGEIQAIGGVNQKIEGFFDVCKLKGLTGEQGVIIPFSNVQNLMLRDDVIKAVEEGKFHIWAVKTVEEGIEILTGLPAGDRLEDGSFPSDTIYYRIDQKLKQFAESIKEVGKEEGEKEDKKEKQRESK